jgi:hypothetical protein
MKSGAEASSGPVCLTLDVEPDYGRTDTTRILDRISPFLDWVATNRIPITAFVTGQLISQRHPVVDQLLAAGISVELHGYAHRADGFGTLRDFHADEINRGTEAYVKRFGDVPAGYRAPAGVISAADIQLLASLGYQYDSSVFPVRRKGRYDFSSFPRYPFRWTEPDLPEFPVGLLLPRIPAGLSFINLLGPTLAAALIRRASQRIRVPYVVDGHFHNLFTDSAALATLPIGLRGLYAMGQWSGGFAGFRSLVDRLRDAGVLLSGLHEIATQNKATLPVVSLAAFESQVAP